MLVCCKSCTCRVVHLKSCASEAVDVCCTPGEFLSSERWEWEEEVDEEVKGEGLRPYWWRPTSCSREDEERPRIG
jgi:hypothetical protein